MAGAVGGGDRMDFTVMGDTVNTSARIQTAAKPGQILVGSDTYQFADAKFDFKELEPVSVKNKKEPVSKRSTQHDLRLLRGLELIELEDAKYHLKASQREFTKSDLELALKHSRKLLRPWTENYQNRYSWLDLLVFKHLETEPLEPSDEMCLLQHLKSANYLARW